MIDNEAEAIAAVERLLRDKMQQDRYRQDGVSTVRNLRPLDVGEEGDVPATAREMVLTQRGRCALCDASLGPPRSDNTLWAWSIDRIESAGRAGHLKDNVQLTHLGCNRLKGADSDSEARTFFAMLRTQGPIAR